MSWVLFRCHNCGAEPRLDAGLLTVIIDLTTDRGSVLTVCPLCGHDGEIELDPHVQGQMLRGGSLLAIRKG